MENGYMDQIIKAEELEKRKVEELKKIRTKKAELLKKEKERIEKEKTKWFEELRNQLDPLLIKLHGENYRNELGVETVIEIVSEAFKPERNEEVAYEDTCEDGFN